MTSESGLGELAERFGRALPSLQGLVDETRSVRGDPASSTDPTGTIHVVLAADGLPDSIRVDGDWRRRVGATDLAAAVTQACQQAIVRHGELVAAAIAKDGWSDRVSDVLSYIAGAGPAPDRAAAPRRPWSPPTFASMQALLTAVARIADAEPDRIGGPPAWAPPDYTGAVALGRLTLTLTALGTITCDADPDWVAGQEARDLEEALATALAALRDDLAAVDPERVHSGRR